MSAISSRLPIGKLNFFAKCKEVTDKGSIPRDSGDPAASSRVNMST
jgi:hypothetical protein